MANFYRDLIKILREAGCVFVRQGRGDHEVWYSPITKNKFTVDKGIPSRHTANNIMKEAGLPKAF